MDVRNNNSFNLAVNQIASKGNNISAQDLKNAAQSALQNDGIIDENEAKSLRELGSTMASSATDKKIASIQNFASSEIDPIKKGLNFIMEGARNQRASVQVKQAVANLQEAQEGIIEGAARGLAKGEGVVASAFQWATGRDKNGNTTEQNQNAEQVAKKTLVNRNSAATYNAEPAKSITCVGDALSMIKKNVAGVQAKWSKPPEAVDLSNPEVAKSNLKKFTSMDWSVRDLKSNDPSSILKGKEGKAMIMDNNHAYAFIGIKDGKVMVKDRSGLPKTLDPKKDNLTAFVAGKVEGSDSVAQKDKNVQTYANIMSTPAMQREKGTESGELRKLFVFMSDPSMKAKSGEFSKLVGNIKDFNDNQNIDKLNSFLKAQSPSISLEKDELVAMSKSLTAPLPQNSKLKDFYGKDANVQPKNMLQAFEWVKSSRSENSTSVVGGLEYSNVDLKDYFTNTSSANTNANAMLNQLNLLLCGKGGC